MTPENRWIGAAEAQALLGVGKVSFWEGRKTGRYPQPVMMISNRPIFDRDQILTAKETAA